MEVGIDPMAVIQMATLQNATAIGMIDELGSIEISKWADLMIIKGNPEEDIRNTRNVHSVIMGGRLHRSEELLKYCVGRLGPQSKRSWLEKN